MKLTALLLTAAIILSACTLSSELTTALPQSTDLADSSLASSSHAVEETPETPSSSKSNTETNKPTSSTAPESPVLSDGENNGEEETVYQPETIEEWIKLYENGEPAEIVLDAIYDGTPTTVLLDYNGVASYYTLGGSVLGPSGREVREWATCYVLGSGAKPYIVPKSIPQEEHTEQPSIPSPPGKGQISPEQAIEIAKEVCYASYAIEAFSQLWGTDYIYGLPCYIVDVYLHTEYPNSLFENCQYAVNINGGNVIFRLDRTTLKWVIIGDKNERVIRNNTDYPKYEDWKDVFPGEYVNLSYGSSEESNYYLLEEWFDSYEAGIPAQVNVMCPSYTIPFILYRLTGDGTSTVKVEHYIPHFSASYYSEGKTSFATDKVYENTVYYVIGDSGERQPSERQPIEFLKMSQNPRSELSYYYPPFLRAREFYLPADFAGKGFDLYIYDNNIKEYNIRRVENTRESYTVADIVAMLEVEFNVSPNVPRIVRDFDVVTIDCDYDTYKILPDDFKYSVAKSVQMNIVGAPWVTFSHSVYDFLYPPGSPSLGSISANDAIEIALRKSREEWESWGRGHVDDTFANLTNAIISGAEYINGQLCYVVDLLDENGALTGLTYAISANGGNLIFYPNHADGGWILDSDTSERRIVAKIS